MSSHAEGETDTHHTELTVERGRVNAITVKAANTSQSKSTWNPGACTYQKHHCTMGKQVLFVVNSIKLHLTALNLVM